VNLSFKPKTFAAMLAVCAEPDLSFALIDIEARDAVAAVAAGWAAFDPGFIRPLDVELPQRPAQWLGRSAFFPLSNLRERKADCWESAGGIG
jgi:hypothetical protein